MKKNNTTTLDEFKDKHYGKPGTPKRDELSNLNFGKTSKFF